MSEEIDPRDPDYLLTVDELAAKLRMTRSAIYCMEHRGDAPPSARVGRRRLYRLRDVNEWLDAKFNA